MTKRIHVDRGRCTGIGMCEAVAPNHFEVDDEAEVTLLVEEVTEKDRALIEEAVRACPALALRLEEA